MSAPMRPPAPGAQGVCPACGTAVLAHDAFCTACGTALSASWAGPVIKGAPPGPGLADDSLEAILEIALGRPAAQLSLAAAQLEVARALLDRGQPTEAIRTATEGLTVMGADEGPELAADLLTVRAWAQLGASRLPASVTDAWEAVMARGGSEAGLVPLATLAITSAPTKLADLPAKLVEALPAPGPAEPPDRGVARFLLLVRLGRLRDAARAIGSGRGWSSQPTPVPTQAQAALIRSWLADHGRAGAAALHALLLDALGQQPEELPEESDLAGPLGALWLPVLRVRARSAAAAGQLDTAAADFLAAAQGEDYTQALDLLRADLESALQLAPTRADVLYLSADFERVAAGELSQPADRVLLARARTRWQAAAQVDPPDQANAWVLSALAAIVDAEDSPRLAEVWEGVLALSCRVLIEPQQDLLWLELAGPLRQVRQFELSRFANQRAADHGAPADQVRTALLLQSWVHGLIPDPAELAEWLGQSPDDVLALFLQGSSALREGRVEPAVKALSQVASLEPNFLIGRAFLGLAQACAASPAAAGTLLGVLGDLTGDGREAREQTAQEQTLLLLASALVGDPAQAEAMFVAARAGAQDSTTDLADLLSGGVLAAAARPVADLAGQRLGELLDLQSQRPVPTSLPDLSTFLAALAYLRPQCSPVAGNLRTQLADFTTRAGMPVLPGVGQDQAHSLLDQLATAPAGQALAAASARVLQAALLLRSNQREQARKHLAQAAALEVPDWALACIRVAGTDSELDDAVERMCSAGAPGAEDIQRAFTAAQTLSSVDPGGLIAERITRCASDGAGLWRARCALSAGLAQMPGRLLDGAAVIGPIDAELARRINAGLPAEPPPSPAAVVCELGDWLVPADAVEQWPTWAMFTEVIPRMREDVLESVGFRPPGVRVRPDPGLGATKMRLMLHDDPRTAVVAQVPNVTSQLGLIGLPDGAPAEVIRHDHQAMGWLGARLAEQVTAWAGQLLVVDTVAEMLGQPGVAGASSATAMPTDPLAAARVTAAVRWAIQAGHRVTGATLAPAAPSIAAAKDLSSALERLGLHRAPVPTAARHPGPAAEPSPAPVADTSIIVAGQPDTIGRLIEAMEVGGELQGLRAQVRQLYGLELPAVQLQAEAITGPDRLLLSWQGSQHEVPGGAPHLAGFTAAVLTLVGAGRESLASPQALNLALAGLARDYPGLARVVGGLWDADDLRVCLSRQLHRAGTIGPAPIWAQAVSDMATGWPELGPQVLAQAVEQFTGNLG